MSEKCSPLILDGENDDKRYGPITAIKTTYYALRCQNCPDCCLVEQEAYNSLQNFASSPIPDVFIAAAMSPRILLDLTRWWMREGNAEIFSKEDLKTLAAMAVSIKKKLKRYPNAVSGKQ